MFRALDQELRVAIAIVLLTAALAKTVRPRNLEAVFAFTAIRSVPLRVILGVVLVVAEILTGVGIVTGPLQSTCVWIACALFVGFAVAAVIALRRTQNGVCNCLGGLVTLRYDLVGIVFNVALACAVAGDLAAGGPQLDPGWSFRSWVALVGSGFVGACTYWLALYARSVVIEPNWAAVSLGDDA